MFAALFVAHALVTAVALVRVGYLGIFEEALAGWGAGQVVSDLSVALVLVNVWMLFDAKKQGWNAWPYVVLSLPLGSLAPLAYLLRREIRLAEPQPTRAVARS
ncbi:MAG TPA: hypothetical protein VFB62_26200 [Polyangiaceae bacterium]|nr:hypothetical protein [Polyangiaceae bacterium]